MTLRLTALPTNEIVPASYKPGSDPTAEAFVQYLRCSGLHGLWRADDVWGLYVDWFAEGTGSFDEPVSRGQLFRQIGAAGLRRRRDTTGRRRYRYFLANRNSARAVDRPSAVRLGTVSG